MMENWDKVEHDFGQVPHSSIQRTTFTYTGDKEIKEIEPLCSCVGFTFSNNQLNLSWKTKPNPEYSYDSKKVVMIIYKDQSIDDLTLKAYITK